MVEEKRRASFYHKLSNFIAIAFDMQILGVNILRAQKEHIAY